MADVNRRPALLLDWLTPVYDHFVRLVLRERRFKRELVARARIARGHRVLDMGAGTGTLVIMMKQVHPNALVTGLDGDPAVLSIAREKASRAGADVRLDLGDVAALPYPDGAFDRVVSSLVFSLLSSEVKRQAFREAFRVLGRGGELLIADFGAPRTAWGRLLARRMCRFEPIADNLKGLLPVMFREAGFQGVDEAARLDTLLGTLSILRGRKSA